MKISLEPLYQADQKVTLYVTKIQFIERDHEIKIEPVIVDTETTKTPVVIITEEIEITIKHVIQHRFQLGEFTLNRHGIGYLAEDTDGRSYYLNYVEHDSRNGDRSAPMIWSTDQLAWESDLKTAENFSGKPGSVAIKMCVFHNQTLSVKSLYAFKKVGAEYIPFTP